MSITPTEALTRCIEHREIFEDEMLSLWRRLMSGELTPVQIAALTMGLRVKKETVGEIAAAAQIMREFATKVEVADRRHLVDIVGTGGDSSHTFNISTAATMVGELRDGTVREYEIHPEDFGLSMVSNRGLKVANAEQSKAMLLEALDNTPGTPREIVVFNAGVALYAADVAASIAEGIERARAAMASGAARRKLDEFVAGTQRLGA
jgi:anthranilate phosphoribosyltransferase